MDPVHGLVYITVYASNYSDTHPESPYTLNLMEKLVREHGSDNLIVFKEIPIKVDVICSPLRSDENTLDS